MKILDLIKKHKSIILYIIFGVATTIVNIVVYYICSHVLKLQTVGSTCVAWVFAVLFAYVTNRIWVFESRAASLHEIIAEIIKFFLCRIATGVFDVVFMYICVDYAGYNDVVIKAFSNVVVIVLNYVASKLIVFKKANI